MWLDVIQCGLGWSVGHMFAPTISPVGTPSSASAETRPMRGHTLGREPFVTATEEVSNDLIRNCFRARLIERASEP